MTVTGDRAVLMSLLTQKLWHVELALYGFATALTSVSWVWPSGGAFPIYQGFTQNSARVGEGTYLSVISSNWVKCLRTLKLDYLLTYHKLLWGPLL